MEPPTKISRIVRIVSNEVDKSSSFNGNIIQNRYEYDTDIYSYSPPSLSPSSTMDHYEQSQEQQQPHRPRSSSLQTITSCMKHTSSRKRTNRATRQAQLVVSFAQTSQVLILPRRTSMDVHCSWYNKEDLGQFKVAMRESAQSFSKTRTATLLMKHVAYLAAMTTSTTSSSAQTSPSNSTTPTSNGTALPLPTKNLHAIRGIEHMLCPVLSEVLLSRRKLRVARVLDEQRKVDDEYLAERSSTGSATNMSRDDMNVRVERIARVSRSNSRFNVEWTRRIVALHQE